MNEHSEQQRREEEPHDISFDDWRLASGATHVSLDDAEDLAIGIERLASTDRSQWVPAGGVREADELKAAIRWRLDGLMALKISCVIE